MGTGQKTSRPEGDAPEALSVIDETTRQTLELVRRLVELLLAKEGAGDGPTLEDMIAAQVAQQRELLAAVKRIEETVDAVADHLLGPSGGSAGNGRADGHARA